MVILLTVTSESSVCVRILFLIFWSFVQAAADEVLDAEAVADGVYADEAAADIEIADAVPRQRW